jgi:GNAT superfamily N-acetyltransferase
MIPEQEKSERVERAALQSLHSHCPPQTKEALDLFCEEVGDALVVGAGKDPSILLNRSLGLGTSAPQESERLREIHKIYEDHGVERYFLHTYPDSLVDGEEALSSVPLVAARGWMKFKRGNEASPTGECDLRVTRVGEEGAGDFGRIVAAAFGMTPAAGPALAAMVADNRWHLFVSYEGEHAAGAGGLFVDEGIAWFEWGATDPKFRRRGSQGAIMRARIAAALKLGCTTMYTETGEAVGGDPQHSYGNIQRYGFVESILRKNWAPPKG